MTLRYVPAIYASPGRRGRGSGTAKLKPGSEGGVRAARITSAISLSLSRLSFPDTHGWGALVRDGGGVRGQPLAPLLKQLAAIALIPRPAENTKRLCFPYSRTDDK